MLMPKVPRNHSVSHYNMLITFSYIPLLSIVIPRFDNRIKQLTSTMTKRIPSLANLSYPEHLAALDLEPLELRRLIESDLVLYCKCSHDLVALHSR